MKRNVIKSLDFKIPSVYLELKELLPPTALKVLTSSNYPGGVAILTYWFNTEIKSQKQLRWLGNIKATVKKIFPGADTNIEPPESLKTFSGEIYSMKEVSDSFKKLLAKDKHYSLMPKYTPMFTDGKPEWNLQRSLYRYGKRLYYYHSLCIEYMLVASAHYNELMPTRRVSRKVENKAAYSVLTRLNEDIDRNPQGFTQKLSDEEYVSVKKKQAIHLQIGNRIKREQSTNLVQEALKEPSAYKKNGKVNIAKLAKLSGLNIRTVKAVLADSS